jgi:Zn-finger nucleic acid-binding protein
MVFRDRHWLCPRCGVPLESVRALGNRFQRCPTCRGAFVDPSTLARMIQDMGGATPPSEPIAGERPLGCPACSQPMSRSALSTPDGAIHLDTCATHGMWFDTRELQLTLEAVGLAALAQ